MLTSKDFHELYPRAIVCPITSNMTPWPTKVFLPEGMQTRGAVLADQPCTIHRSERGFRLIEPAPEEVHAMVRTILRELLQIVV